MKYSLSKILIQESIYKGTHNLKLRLLKEGLLKNSCYICGIGEWLGDSLSFHLDHINGIRNDNRIENLRLLCPNCHSQTETYAGKKNIQYREGWLKHRKNKKCKDCDKSIWNCAIRCKKCHGRYAATFKIDWPDTKTLIEMVEKSSYVAVGRVLGVSNVAVRKHIINNQSNTSDPI